MPVILDLKGLEKRLGKMGDEAEKALVSAINKTAAQGLTQMSKAVRSKYDIKASRFRAATHLRKAKRGDITAYISAKGAPVGLRNYKARQTKKGVAVSVFRGGRKTVKGAFMANAPGQGMPSIWRRDKSEPKRRPSKGRYKGKAPRQPIERLVGPSVPQMVNKVGAQEARRFVAKKFPSIYKHEYWFRMGKLR